MITSLYCLLSFRRKLSFYKMVTILYIYKGRLPSSDDDVISAIKKLLATEIQALQHQLKKSVDLKGTMLKNKPHLNTFHDTVLVCLWTCKPNLLWEVGIKTYPNIYLHENLAYLFSSWKFYVRIANVDLPEY